MFLRKFNKGYPLVGLFFLLLLLAPLFLSDFRLNLLAKFLTYCIVAIAIDLVWGYGGMLSLGHGIFFGIGAYSMAMYLKLEASGESLPDFMVWSGLTELPFFWKPFQSFSFALLCSLVMPAIVAGLMGYMIFRSGIRGVYFSIITQASALILSILIIGQQPYTGGTNGITNFDTILGFSLASRDVQLVLYLTTVLSLLVSLFVCYKLLNSRFGKILIAIRDMEERVRFCGYDTVKFKTFALALSASLAGLAGALFVAQVGIISPAMIGVVPSIEMVIWVAVGGRATLMGAVVGALLVNSAKTYLSESFPDLWLYFQGLLFVLVVLLFPQGISGLTRKFFGEHKTSRRLLTSEE
ncbi:MAG: urea ABC transporter permease subunit UrtC [Candidatus Jordarchaeaceae archaeon]